MADLGSGGFGCLSYCTGFRVFRSRGEDEAPIVQPSQFSCARAGDAMRERGRAKGAFVPYGFIHASAMSMLWLSSHGLPMVGVLGHAICQTSSCV